MRFSTQQLTRSTPPQAEIKEMEKKRETTSVAKLDAVIKVLVKKKATLTKVKAEIVNRTENCLKELKKQKDEIMKKFDQMIKYVTDQSEKTSSDMDEAFRAIDDELTHLEAMKENITTGTMNRDAAIDKLVINDSEEDIRETLSGTRTYRYYEYMKNTADVKKLCGEITAQEITVNLSGEGRVVAAPASMPGIAAASQLNCTGKIYNRINKKFF